MKVYKINAKYLIAIFPMSNKLVNAFYHVYQAD